MDSDQGIRSLDEKDLIDKGLHERTCSLHDSGILTATVCVCFFSLSGFSHVFHYSV